jgi:hypothetical protein
MTAVSSKNTKGEILQAYEEMQNEINTLRRESRKESQTAEKKKEVVIEASQFSPESIIKNISELKFRINKFSTELTDSITLEFEKLTKLRQAIDIEKENIRDLHEISVTADSLEVLLLAQKRKREEFEKEMQAMRIQFEEDMAQKRHQFKLEITISETKQKEEKERLEKQRQREQDDYQYVLQTERKKESDAYELTKTNLERELAEKKTAFEKSIAEREAHLKSRETDYLDLQKQVQIFPQTLEKSIKDAVKTAIDKLELQYKYETDLLNKEYQGEIKLNQQMITALKEKIQEQENYIAQLKQGTSQANTRVQEIAIKAIESNSNSRQLSTAFVENQRVSKNDEKQNLN